MIRQLRAASVALILLTLVTGVLYPVAITAAAQLVFPHQANGSLLVRNGQVIGSELIGQPFDDPAYFWSRPSATGPAPYNALASSGSNLGPLNPALPAAIQERIAALRSDNPANPGPAPVDLVTSSGSGLDPHISPAAAAYQIQRVARTRNLGESQVAALVQQYTEGRSLGFLGEPRVNVLKLNLALDALK